MTATYVTHGVCDDARCTMALGPECVCACLGASHGSVYAQETTSKVYVTTVQDAVDEARRAARVAGRLAAERFAAKLAAKAAGPVRDSRGRFVKAA